MITELSIFNVYGDSMSFPIPSGGDGYLIKDIKGLDPVPVSLVSTPQANLPGERFQASKREKRNIVLTIEMQRGWASTSVEARRRALYSLLPPEQNVTLFFEDTEFGRVHIDGRVETFEAPIFGQDSSKATISIMCFNPEFVGETVEVSFGTDQAYTVVSYPGTVPCGLTIEATMSKTITQYAVIRHELESPTILWTALLTALPNLLALSMGTSPGNKYISSSSASLLTARENNFVWPYLEPGDNRLRITTTPLGRATSLVSYRPLYGAL